MDAIDRYAAFGERAVAVGNADGAQSVLNTFSSVFTENVLTRLDERDRAAVIASLVRLQKAIRGSDGPVGGDPPLDGTTRNEL